MAASFPGSAKSFTTKSDGAGNTILAAHINDVQLEVTAIERTLLGTTALDLVITGTITASGVLTVSGFGTHAFNAAGTGNQRFTVRNTSAGTTNTSQLAVIDDAGKDTALIAYSSTFTTAGPNLASGGKLIAEGAGGLSIVASDASGAIRYYSAGITEVGRWDLTSSLQIGGTAARGTTAGTKRLDIFNGTAPVGTLTNGISLYSAAGELTVMDAAGNATPLSPHDHSPDWVFQCENLVTGKYVRIETEKLLKRLNDLFGEPEWVTETRV